jgi:hypothetical protein
MLHTKSVYINIKVWYEVVTAETHRPEDGGSTGVWNVGKLISVYTALQPGREPSPMVNFIFLSYNHIIHEKPLYRKLWQNLKRILFQASLYMNDTKKKIVTQQYFKFNRYLQLHAIKRTEKLARIRRHIQYTKSKKCTSSFWCAKTSSRSIMWKH